MSMKLFSNILAFMPLCIFFLISGRVHAQQGLDDNVSRQGMSSLNISGKDNDHFSNLFVQTNNPTGDPGMSTLNPKAIPFVKDYLDDNYERLQHMKGWGDPYFKLIEKILIRYNLPPELKYLAVIESDLKSAALSWAGARGPWQLMPETGRDLGLKVTLGHDERIDFYKSTHAAAKYLRDLYGELGDWLLVIAAYNGGQARVESAIRKSGSRDFWKLQYSLPPESRNHVKKFIATHYIMEGQGGITTTGAGEKNKIVETADSTLIAGTVTRQISGKYRSSIVAKSLGMDIAIFDLLNPRFNMLVTIQEYTLRLPAEKMEIFNSNRLQILNESVQFILNGQADEAENFKQDIRILDLKKAGGNTRL